MASPPNNLKEKLMEYLEEFRATNYAFNLCNLLIRIQDHEECEDEALNMGKLWPYCPNLVDFTVNYIKYIVDTGFADKIVEIVFEALRAPKETSDEKALLVSNLNSISECEEERYACLHRLIRILESAVDMYFEAGIRVLYNDRIDRYLNRKLVKLKTSLVGRRVKLITDRLLIKIFFCCLYDFEFSWTEKRKIGAAIIEAIPLIHKRIKIASTHYDFRIAIVNLQRRSALQFIKELFIDCFSEDDYFKENVGKLDTVIQFLDNDISLKIRLDKEFLDADSDKECPEEIAYHLETIEDFNEAGACHVPESHNWWKKYKEAYFN